MVGDRPFVNEAAAFHCWAAAGSAMEAARMRKVNSSLPRCSTATAYELLSVTFGLRNCAMVCWLNCGGRVAKSRLCR